MAPISILYHAEDAEKWSRYLHKLISQHGEDSDVKLLDLEKNSSMLQNTVDTSTVVAVLVSPCMLGPEMENVFKELQGHKQKDIVLLSCFLEEEEKEEILDKFTFLQSLKILKVTVNKQENIALVSELLDTVDIADRAAKRRRLQMKKNALKFRCIPNTVYQQAILVYLNFEREVRGTVTVSFGKSKENRIGTEVYNPFSVMFTAENLSEGKNKVCVFVDDHLVGKCELLFQSPILSAFESPLYLCQALGLGSNDMESLDKRLVNIFKQSAPDDQSHISLMGTNIYENPQESQSIAEVPSLLHFAAKNGLSDLCSLLMNIPGASNVYRITNLRGKNVYDLAIESGSHELANYTKLFLETEAMVLACDTIYLSRSRLQRDEASSMSKEDNQRQTKTSKPRYSPVSHKHSSTEDISNLPAKPEDTMPKQTRTSRKDLQPLIRIYSLQKENFGKTVRSQSCVRDIGDRPPQPPPRFASPVPQRRGRSRYQSETDLHEQKSCDAIAMEPPLSKEFLRRKLSEDRYPKENFKSGSKAMDELVEITRQTVGNQFTIKEAERLYESWKKRNQNPSASIRQKKQNLQELRDKYENLIKESPEDNKSAINGILGKFKKVFTSKKIKETDLQISSPLYQKQSIDSVVQGRWSNTSSLSSGSSGSRESQFSTGSRDSTMGASVEGSDSDELVEEESTDVECRKKSENHMTTSKREKFLRSISISSEVNLPPPEIPPRKFPPQTVPARKPQGPMSFVQ